MKKKLLLIGGGGHCRSVLDSVMALNSYDEIGIIDNIINNPCLGISVIGTDDDLPTLKKNGWNDAIITVGSVGDTKARRRLYEMIKNLGFATPSIIDPTAIISREVVMKDGCFIGKRAVVNTGTILGECCIINSGAIIEHDCEIGMFAHVSTGAVLCGQVRVGSDTHIGAGTVVRQQITIGDDALIGAGSIVVRDISGHVKAYGNPCKVVE